MKIKGLGTYQDAGQLRNNPIFSALSEAEALFPHAQEPDFVVSLGTGCPRSDPAGPDASGTRGLIKDGCFPRCFRAFWETMRGSRDWQALTSSGRPKSSGKFHRLDVEFDGLEPRLDEVANIPSLQSKVLEDPSIASVIDNIAHCAISSLFFFELHTMPKRIGEEYVGSGSIRCVLSQREPAFEVLMRELRKNHARILLGENHIADIDDVRNFDQTGGFSCQFGVTVRAAFSIFLQEDNGPPCNISGSPFSMEEVIHAQGLDAYLGTANHLKRKWPGDGYEDSGGKRRRL